MRILLVEDHEDTASIFRRVLVSEGHAVDVAGSAHSAKELCARSNYDLLLVDIGLPDASGWELLKGLLRRCPMRAIAVSGFGFPEDIRKSREAGFALHLTKPVDLNTLRAAIKSVGKSPLTDLPESAALTPLEP